MVALIERTINLWTNRNKNRRTAYKKKRLKEKKICICAHGKKARKIYVYWRSLVCSGSVIAISVSIWKSSNIIDFFFLFVIRFACILHMMLMTSNFSDTEIPFRYHCRFHPNERMNHCIAIRYNSIFHSVICWTDG